MKYLKHYWIDCHNNGYCCHENPIEKRHPESEYPGLDVKAWMHDPDGIDVCLAVVPDTTTVEDVISPHNGKKVIQSLTEIQFNSVYTPLTESQQLSFEAQQETDPELKTQKETAAATKYQEAVTALHSL
jgi:hypothetical protein